jgi:hypothetical protein
MGKSDDKLYAVLTGDIVGSSRLSVKEFKSVKDCLKEASREMDNLCKSADSLVIGDIDFYRGDGWQLLFAQPRYVLRGCLFLRAYLRAYCDADTRIAVGIGEVEHIDRNRISQSTGAAFQLSGSALDKLKRRRRMTIVLSDKQAGKNFLLASVFELSDAIVQGWTQKQAETMLWALKGYKQVEIAEKQGKKQQSVGESLNFSGWYAIEPVLEQLEKTGA